MFEPIGYIGVSGIMQALTDLRYKHLEDLKFVKSDLCDEGVSEVCKFVQISKSVKILNLPHNNITYRGCDYLGTALEPRY